MFVSTRTPLALVRVDKDYEHTVSCGRLSRIEFIEMNGISRSSVILSALCVCLVSLVWGSTPAKMGGKPLIPRFSAENQNFVSKWQLKGDLYISHDNLLNLNRQCMTFEDKNSNEEMRKLLDEVMMTYFARFHNVLRDEFQYEKEAVEERLKTWPVGKLAKEGFTIFNLYGHSKGSVYQEQVFRFKVGSDKKGSKPLPFHRFSVGDSVVISPHKESTWSSRGGSSGDDLDVADDGGEGKRGKGRRNRAEGGSWGDPLGESAIDGIVMSRRKGYLDVSVKAIDALEIGRDQAYRLETVVNRVSYDRMMNSLQLFLQSDEGVPPLSRTLRDLILFSYPNSISRLANTPGGLRMALPSDGSLTDQDSAASGERKLDRRRNRGGKSGGSGGEGARGAATYEQSTRQKRREEEAFAAGGSSADDLTSRDDDDVLARLSAALGDDEEEDEEDIDDGGDGADSFAWEQEQRRRQRELQRRQQEQIQEGYTGAPSSGEEGGADPDPVRAKAPKEQLQQPPVRARNREAEVLLRGLQGRSSDAQPQPRGQGQGQSQSEEEGKRKSLTVAEQLRLLQGDGLTASSSSVKSPEGGRGRGTGVVYGSFPILEDMSCDLDAVFCTNTKLAAMSRRSPAGGSVPYSEEEISRVVHALTHPHEDGGGATAGQSKGKGSRQAVRLNHSQLRALFAAVQLPVSLIQGPPGTGKTTTATSILTAITLLKYNRLAVGGSAAQGQKNAKILACAHSNVATDNLLAGLVKTGVKVLRLGRPTNVQTQLWNYTLDANLQKDPVWATARSRLDRSIAFYGEMREIGGPQFGVAQRMLEKAQTRFFMVEKKCTQQLLSAADVVVSTCIGSGADLLREFGEEEGAKFATVLLDEAAQCMESALLPALVLGAERLILIGDQNQLPPVVASPQALEYGLGVSLFARLATGGITPVLLDEQYRMHPKIAEFPSRAFYQGKVKSQVDPALRPIPEGFPWPRRDVPVCFIDVSPPADQARAMENDDGSVSVPTSGGYENVASAGSSVVPGQTATSYFNEEEAEEVVSIVESLLQPRGSLQRGDIGVVSPYSGQVCLLADRFKQKGWIDEDNLSNNLGEQYRDVSTGSGSGSGVTGSGSASGERSEHRGVFERRKPLGARADDEGDADGDSNEAVAGGGGTERQFKFTAEDEDDLGFLAELGSSGVKKGKKSGPRGGSGGGGLRKEEVEARAEEDKEEKDRRQAQQADSVRDRYPELFDDGGEDEALWDVSLYDGLGTGAVDDKQHSRSPAASSASASGEKVANIEVRSVDGYQGREKDAIVFSAVRSNRLGRVGFLKDWRRLNVALTRARNGIIVVGDSRTLRYEANWRAFIDWTKTEGVYINRRK